MGFVGWGGDVFSRAGAVGVLAVHVAAVANVPVNVFVVLMKSMTVTFDTSHLERSPLNDEAELNMYCMLVTFDTSHLDRSPLNDEAP